MSESVRIDGRTRNTRARIRDAAIYLFFAQGFSATSVREITAACSVTPGALYNHYPSKDDILVDIFRKSTGDIDRKVSRAIEGLNSASQRVAQMAFTVTEYHADHREIGTIILNQSAWLPEKEQQAWGEWLRAYRRRLEDILADGIETGEFRIPLMGQIEDAIALTAKALFDMWTQVGSWFRPDGGTSGHDLARLYSRLALQCVCGEYEVTSDPTTAGS